MEEVLPEKVEAARVVQVHGLVRRWVGGSVRVEGQNRRMFVTVAEQRWGSEERGTGEAVGGVYGRWAPRLGDIDDPEAALKIEEVVLGEVRVDEVAHLADTGADRPHRAVSEEQGKSSRPGGKEKERGRQRGRARYIVRTSVTSCM